MTGLSVGLIWKNVHIVFTRRILKDFGSINRYYSQLFHAYAQNLALELLNFIDQNFETLYTEQV